MATSVTSGGEFLQTAETNVKELNRRLRKAGNDLKDLKQANKEAAEVVVPAAKSRAPQSTGALRGSIRASGQVRAGVVRAGKKQIPYAGVIHFGWPERNISANPFLADAAKATEPKWAQIYEKAVNNAITHITGK